MPSNIIIFPDHDQLKTEIDMLRTELSMLVSERDELIYVECKNIEMAYMLELGSLEYKAYEAQCTYLRLKRKVELIQVKKNRMESVDLVAIEAILDAEFAEYQEKLNEQIDKMNKAIDWNKAEFLSKEEMAQLKKLYHRIVKALHPDLHPENTEEKTALYDRAVKAYRNGDLNTLRIIGELILESTLSDIHEDILQSIVKEKKRLNNLIGKLRKNIHDIRNGYPYNLKSLLSDSVRIEKRREELKDIIRQYGCAIASYKEYIESIFG